MRTRYFALFALAALSLGSCGNTSLAGTYAFQMGRDKGVHGRAEMRLTDKPVYSTQDPTQLLGNEFRFVIDVQTSESKASSSKAISEITSESVASSSAASSSGSSADFSFDKIIEIAYKFLGDGESMVGYYRVGEAIDSGNLLPMGFMVPDEVVAMIADIVEVPAEGLQISPDMTEELVYSTITGKTVNLSVPVSIPDLLLQLYWYGTDIHFEEGSLRIDTLPNPHKPGTHPTADEVKAINQDPLYKTRHPGQTFRDYFTVTLSLVKQ